MFFLIPRATLVLLALFLVLSILRARRRRHYISRGSTLERAAARLGRRSVRRRRIARQARQPIDVSARTAPSPDAQRASGG